MRHYIVSTLALAFIFTMFGCSSGPSIVSEYDEFQQTTRYRVLPFETVSGFGSSLTTGALHISAEYNCKGREKCIPGVVVFRARRAGSELGWTSLTKLEVISDDARHSYTSVVYDPEVGQIVVEDLYFEIPREEFVEFVNAKRAAVRIGLIQEEVTAEDRAGLKLLTQSWQ